MIKLKNALGVIVFINQKNSREVKQLKGGIKGMEIKNARISKVSISMANHGCLTFTLFLDGCGWGCGFGNYCIGHGYLGADNFEGYGNGLEAMMRIMDTVGVENWEDLEGKYVRCKVGNWGDTIDEIGNILKDKWFNIRDFFSLTSV